MSDVVRKCELCGHTLSIDMKSSIDYMTILCYDCARRVDAEYIKYCESLIERAKVIINGKAKK